MYIFLEEDLTMLPYFPYRANQGSISFFQSHLFLLLHFLLNIGDNVRLKCKGVTWDTLETTTSLDFCFI